MTIELKVGTVFIWKNFPFPRHGEVKNRYFIYLGDSSSLLTPTISASVITYISTTTTPKIDLKYEIKDYYYFNANESPFDKDCIMYFDQFSFYNNVPKSFLENSENIQIKGKLKTNVLKEIYNKILKSKYPKNAKIDIYDSFKRDNITGLKAPK